MSRQSWWQKIYWTRFAKPVEERALARFLVNHPIQSVLEIGIGEGARLARMAKLVNLVDPSQPLRYIGVDEFESAQGRAFLTLKQAHQLATQVGFKASLIPGTPQAALPRVAHKFGPSDLVLVSSGIDPDQPMSGPIGSWLDRLAHSRSTVIAASQVGTDLVVLDARKLTLPLSRAA